VISFTLLSIPIFGIVVLGWAAVKAQLTPPAALDALGAFSFRFALPALVMRLIAREPLSHSFNPLFLQAISRADASCSRSPSAYRVAFSGKILGSPARAQPRPRSAISASSALRSFLRSSASAEPVRSRSSTGILIASLPSAGSNYVLAQRYAADAERVSAGIALSTVISLATVPFVGWLVVGP